MGGEGVGSQASEDWRFELKTETMRAALVDQEYVFRGDVVRMTRQVAFGEGVIRDREGGIISRATATFLLHRVEE